MYIFKTLVQAVFSTQHPPERLQDLRGGFPNITREIRAIILF